MASKFFDSIAVQFFNVELMFDVSSGTRFQTAPLVDRTEFKAQSIWENGKNRYRSSDQNKLIKINLAS